MSTLICIPAEGDTWPLLGNARWLPFVIAHGGLDELVPPLLLASRS